MSLYKVLLIIVLVYASLNILLYFTQELFIFQSGKKLPSDYQFNFNFKFEEVYLRPDTNSQIHGLLLKAENPRGVILYFHGNRKNVIRWAEITRYFLQYNYDVLVMDYRGYGKSIGVRNENNLHQDALYTYNYLCHNYDPNNIIIYGRSLGTGIATKLAAEVPAKCLILETPYKNMNDLIKRYLFMFPIQWIINYEFRSELFLKDVKCSINIFHGTNDNIVPLESALRLVESTNRRDIKLNIIQEGQHNDLVTFPTYQKEIGLILNN